MGRKQRLDDTFPFLVRRHKDGPFPKAKDFEADGSKKRSRDLQDSLSPPSLLQTDRLNLPWHREIGGHLILEKQ